MSAEGGLVVQILGCGVGLGPQHPGTPGPHGVACTSYGSFLPGCGLGAGTRRGATWCPLLLAQPPGLRPLGRESGLEAGVETSGSGGAEPRGNTRCDLSNSEDASDRVCR